MNRPDIAQYDITVFEKDLYSLSIHLNKRQICQFLKYYELLTEWNQRMNLTAITEYEEVMKKHFIDSVSLIKAYDVTRSVDMIDIGTGAGFPGLALKIAFPDLKVTLLDSLKKRVYFLDTVIEQLDLQGIHTIHGRAEDFAKKEAYRESFDLCVSRAVANLSTLSEYCLPYVKVGGDFISYKSEKIADEQLSAAEAIHILGGEIKEPVAFYLPDSDIYRNLFVIRKVRPTPGKFPRKAGLPGKEPL